MRRDGDAMEVEVYRDGRLESTSRQPLDLAGAIWN